MEPAFATGGGAVMVSNQAPEKMHSTNEGDDTEGKRRRPEARARGAGLVMGDAKIKDPET
jgi:hypothetical protein